MAFNLNNFNERLDQAVARGVDGAKRIASIACSRIGQKEKSIQSWHHRLLLFRSLNHFIRSRKHVRRNRKTDLLGCFQIYDELKLLRLLNGEIGGLGAFEDLVHIGSRTRC